MSFLKKHMMIILSLIILIISFLLGWYADRLFCALFVFMIIPYFVVLVLFLVCFVLSVKKWNFVSIVILCVSVLLFFFFPFREAKVYYDLYRYEAKRLEIIEKIVTKELLPDEIGNVVLEKGDKKLSTSGEVFVYQNDESGVVIGFWVFRGMLSGSNEVIYSSDGEDLIWENETGHSIENIEKLKDNWYYVDTEY